MKQKKIIPCQVQLSVIPTDIPLDWIPYKNRWGHWVWRRKDIQEDKNWPGLKPPSKKATPGVVSGQWRWIEI